MKKTIVLLILAILISGCATGYQRQSWTGGYSNLKIQDDIFKVRFKGNGYTHRRREGNYYSYKGYRYNGKRR